MSQRRKHRELRRARVERWQNLEQMRLLQFVFATEAAAARVANVFLLKVGYNVNINIFLEKRESALFATRRMGIFFPFAEEISYYNSRKRARTAALLAHNGRRSVPPSYERPTDRR